MNVATGFAWTPGDARFAELKRRMSAANGFGRVKQFEACVADAFGLVREGYISAVDAAEQLQQAAEAYGLVADIGDDAVTAILARVAMAADAPPLYDNGSGIGDLLSEDQSGDDIDALAKLSELAYEHERKAAAEGLGVRATLLDKLVAGRRAKLGLDAGAARQGRALEFPEPELWPEPVEGPALLDDIRAAITKYVVMSEHAAVTAALWTVHTWLVDRFLISPRLAIRSPTKGCGKTTLLDILARLVHRPLPSSNVSASVVFRVVAAHQPCLLVDEGDTFLRDNDELRGILNSGHRQGSVALRGVGDEHEPRAFSTYGACAIAMIGQLPDTLTDRSVAIDLKRRLPSERVERFRLDRTAELDELARRIARWAKDHAQEVGAVDPAVPTGLHNRAADNWRTLLAIADVAGGEWPKLARVAAVAGMALNQSDASLTETLLGDIRRVFEGHSDDQLTSEALVARLVEIVPSPWVEFGRGGKPITANRVARFLKPLGIAPQQLWIGGEKTRGYELHQFAEAFDRYLSPQQGGSNRSTGRNAMDVGLLDGSQPVGPESAYRLESVEKPNNDGLPTGLPVAEAETAPEGAALGPGGPDDDGGWLT